MKIKSLLLIAALVAAILPSTSSAQSDKKVLTLSGKITNTNPPDGKYVFTMAELQKLGDSTIKSTTRYTEVGDFTGPKIRDILKYVGAKPDAAAVSVVALDGYQQTIPLTDFTKWDVIAAHSLNGKRLPIEAKGPLWIMYPIDKHPAELMNNATTMKLVWALTGLVVK
jgi:hypothetical protein